MIFIIGGACQGKLDFAKQQFRLQDGDIFSCTDSTLDLSKKCICAMEEFARHHPDPVGYLQAERASWRDSIFIMEDIFCGIVPMGAENRAWRQRCGRLSQYLAGEADRVSRIFCGLELRLK